MATPMGQGNLMKIEKNCLMSLILLSKQSNMGNMRVGHIISNVSLWEQVLAKVMINHSPYYRPVI